MGDLVLVNGLPATAALLVRVAASIDGATVRTSTAGEVISQLEAGSFSGDVIVLGMNVEAPIRIAQRIHSVDVEVPIVVMCAPEHHERLSRAFRLSPFLGPHVYCRALGNAEGLGSALTSAAAKGRERRRRLEELGAANEESGGIAARHASEPARYLDRLLDSAPIGVLVLDAGGHVLSWNERACGIMGVSEREVIGTPLVDLFREGDRARLVQAVQGGASATVERTRPDGSDQTLELSVATVPGHWGEPCAMVLLQDVTERARAERRAQELRDEQLKFVALAENSTDLIAMGSLDGEVFYLNPTGRRTVGLSEAEAKKKRMLQYFAKPFRSRLQTEVLPTVLTTGSWSGEGQVRHMRSGRTIDVLANVFIVRHPTSGEPLCLATVMRDISERKRSEDALRVSEARYRSLFEGCPISIWEEDFSEVKAWFERLRETGIDDVRAWLHEHPAAIPEIKQLIKVIDVNAATVDLFRGRSKAPFLRGVRNDTDETRDLFRDEFAAVADGATRFESETITRTQDGGHIHVVVRWIVAPGCEDTYSRVFVCIVDITDRKRAEEDLRRARDELDLHVRERTAELRAAEEDARQNARFLDSIVENIPNMIFVKEARALRFVRFNKAGEDLLGYARGDLLGKNDYDFFPPDEADFFTRKDREVIDGGRLVDIPEEPIHTRNRGVRFLHTKKIPVADESGRPLYLLGISEDITERRELAEARERQADELARSNAELEQFAYVASHDLQEPLRKIQAFGTMLASRFGEALEPKARDLLDRMRGAASRMQALIDDVLLFSRVTSQVRPFVPVDLATVARDVLADLEVRIRETGATVDVGPLPTVAADPMQMHQLLQNLIGNALKFHRDDVPPEVSLRATQDGSTCTIVVSDRGIGLDEKHEGRIFMPFQRLHGRGKYEGTGMGLAICRRIAERHRGTITVRSEPGHGATFTVSLPQALHPGGGET